MKYFYIDTSSSYLYIGLSNDDYLIESTKKKLNTDLSKYALQEVANLFHKANIEPKEIDKIIVVSGPGSFTGIRIGMTIAKIFSWSLKKEIISITSLDAMSISTKSSKIKVPIIDARRGYVYAGIYEDDKVILKNQYIKLDELIKKLNLLNKEYIYITNDEKIKLENTIKYNPDIFEIINKFKNKKAINPHLIEPTYFKLTEAEEKQGNKTNDN